MDPLDIENVLNVDIQKKLFKIKPPNNDGLLLNIQQSTMRKSSRFIRCDFQSNGNVLAIANNDAQVYIIDLLMYKCWKLPKLESCIYIKLSDYNPSHILVGKSCGSIDILNIESGSFVASLLGHQYAVIAISFTNGNVCVSASKYEAIIWDMDTCSKMQVLYLEKECALKFVLFVPVSNHILVCYQDDIIQVWQNGSFENLKQFHPSNWKNSLLQSLSLSRNGKIMVVSGHRPILAIFQLDIWKLLKIIKLPEYIYSVKKVQFVAQSFDGGCNKLLAILSGNGVVYFYDVEENVLIAELRSKCDIYNFCMSSSNAQHISCLLCSGEVQIYDVNFYVMKHEKTVVTTARDVVRHPKVKIKNFCRGLTPAAKAQLDDLLEIDKLRSIIKEYKEFPDTFRATIWERVLQLPNNTREYNSIINHINHGAFDDLPRNFPLEDKVTIRCLRHVLNNLSTWCPFMAQVEFLPCFLFPFVKIFHKKPIACFELCCTLIINWCQHWFEYHPLPPVNVLAIIDNILIEHNAALLHHFSEFHIKPLSYSWPLLETAFSEVLAAPDWLIFWDHVFINEPSFLLCAVAAFIILQKNRIFVLTKRAEFDDFFHSQAPLDVKKLLKKTYDILKKTSPQNHPRQYLNMFACLTCGTYPTFDEYPKNVVSFQVEQLTYLEDQLKATEKLKEDARRQREERRVFSDTELREEEDRRMMEVEKSCIEKIRKYQENLIQHQEELKMLRQELTEKEKLIAENAERRLNSHLNDTSIKGMDLLADGLGMTKRNYQIEVQNIEEAYKLKELGLIAKAGKIKRGKGDNDSSRTALDEEIYLAHKETLKLQDQIKKARKGLAAPNKAEIALTVSTMNDLIDKIKCELDRERYTTEYQSVEENLKVHRLEKETKALQKDVSRLLHLLAHRKNSINSSDSSHTCSSCPNKTKVRFSASDR